MHENSFELSTEIVRNCLEAAVERMEDLEVPAPMALAMLYYFINQLVMLSPDKETVYHMASQLSKARR